MNLKFIFDELCLGNLSILTLDVYEFIASKATGILNRSKSSIDKEDYEDIRLLCMIGNICYNRTDMTVLPLVDEIYDKLVTLYKKFDPNFQVGSVTVQFQSEVKENAKKAGRPETIDPIQFITHEDRDPVREYYADRLKSFDAKGRYIPDEIFGDKTPISNDGPISKRLHDTQHNHPSLVGTLDKAKFVLDCDAVELDVYDEPATTILERDFFWDHIKRGIITEDQELQMVLELKYDGVSVEADCTDIVKSARTRGDTGIGAASDITPILYGYNFPRNKTLKDREVGVKFEAIIKYSDLIRLNQERGTGYVNARTAMTGIMASSDGYMYRDYITLIPLAVDRDDVPEVKNRMEEIELLNSLYRTKGEPLRYCYIQGNYQTCLFLIKKFLEEAKYARQYLNFMFDGIVVSYLDEGIRAKLGRENFVNKYSIAVKFDPLSVLTTFFGYTFNVGQSGNICPMIHYSPVEFIGTIHDKSSGSSLGRFKELALKPGDIIEVSYTNDVMPYVRSVDNEHNRSNRNPRVDFPSVCPCCGTTLEISKSGDSARCPNWECPERTIARLTATLSKLGIVGFAEESVRALYNKYWMLGPDVEELQNFSTIVNADKTSLIDVLGKADGESLYIQITNLTNILIPDYVYFAALGFTGIGKETWKKIFKVVHCREMFKVLNAEGSLTEYGRRGLVDILLSIKGIGESVVDIIFREWRFFYDDIVEFLYGNFKHVFSKDLQSTDQKIIRFSGCRNKILEDLLCRMGHDADGSAGVTKETDILIVPDANFTSTKTAKLSADAMKVPIYDFVMNIDDYVDDVSGEEDGEYRMQAIEAICEDFGW